MRARRADVLIAGAGIAGSSLAFELAVHRSVILLEAEAQPGYHSTGRSAAMLTETYGRPAVRALTRASRGFLAQPPPDFTDDPLLAPRGMLHVARPDQRQALEAAERQAAGTVRRLDAAGVLALVPLIAPGYIDGGLLEHDAIAIDVNALHQVVTPQLVVGRVTDSSQHRSSPRLQLGPAKMLDPLVRRGPAPTPRCLRSLRFVDSGMRWPRWLH